MPELKFLFCVDNRLTALDVSKNNLLIRLGCFSNELTEIDVKNSPELQFLDCDCNRIEQLDLSNQPELFDLDCSFNNLSEEALNNLFEGLHAVPLLWYPKFLKFRNNKGSLTCNSEIVQQKYWQIYK